MEEKVVNEKVVVVSEQPNNDIDSLQQQIALLQQQLKQKVEQKKVTLNTQLTELETKKSELSTQLANIQQKISEIKKELGIEDNNNSDSEKKVKRTRTKTTDSVKQYYTINGKGKYTAYEIAKEYNIFECYFVKDQNGKTIKKLYANWNRFLPYIINGKSGEGYGELEDKSYRISPVICDKIRKEVKAIDNATTDNANANTDSNTNANTNTQQNANNDNTNANKELLDQLPKNPITDNANVDNSNANNTVVSDNTTQQ